MIDHLTRRGGEHGCFASRRAHRHQRVGERLLQHGATHRTLLGRHRQLRSRIPEDQLGLVGIVVVRRGGEAVNPLLGAVHEHVVAIAVHHHDPHVHRIDHVLQQLLRRGCGLEQRLLLRKRLGELLVPSIHQRQRPHRQHSDLQHDEGQQQRMRHREGVDVRGAHQGRQSDQHRGGRHRDQHAVPAQPGREPQGGHQYQQRDRDGVIPGRVPCERDRAHVQHGYHCAPGRSPLLPPDREGQHGREREHAKRGEVLRGEHQLRMRDARQRREPHQQRREVQLLGARARGG